MADNLRDIFSSIANSIRSKKGTTNTIKPANMSAEIDSISTGTDTSDATATVNDILLGKTAYIGTGKVQGTIPTYDGSYENGVEVTAESCIINVDDFPLENIDAEKIYGKNIKTNVAILMCMEGTIENLSSMMGVECYFVNSLPENPIPISFSDELWHIYIMNNIAYLYFSIDGSSAPTWYSMAEFWYNLGAVGEGFSDKGFIENESLISEDGVYITYSESIAYGIKNKDIFQYDNYANEWININKKIDTLFDKSITYFNCSRYNTIPEYAFYEYTKLSDIKGTENIKFIKDRAFYNCSSLTSINLPNLIDMEGNEAFFGCSNLINIDMPLLKEINGFYYTFAHCTSLTNIEFPELTDIVNGNNSFFNCENLQSVSFPKLNEIIERMFDSCINLNTINAPLVTRIKDGAFTHCTGLTKITSENFPSLQYLDNRLYNIGCFSYCENLLEVELPALGIDDESFWLCEKLHTVNFSNATSIGSKSFYSCVSLINTNFPNVTSIEKDSFSSCYQLQKLSLPKLKNIYGSSGSDEKGFYYCNSLKIVDLGALNKISSDNLFNKCKSLTTIILRNTEKVCVATSSNFRVVDDDCYHFFGTVDSEYNPNGLKDGKIYVPDGLVDSYKSSIYWTEFSDCIVGLSELQEEE